MATIRIETRIRAPIDRCFDLSRSIDFHLRSMAQSGEAVIAGRTKGLIGAGEEVTWRAWHLGCWRTLTSRITEFERPIHFQDAMVRGSFAHYSHDHNFQRDGHATVMQDVFIFESPMGILGRLVNRLLLTRYMTALIAGRAARLKAAVESDEWRLFLDDHVASR